MECFSYVCIKMGVTYVNVCISKHFKEELVRAIDKWLQIISHIMPFKNYTTKKIKNKAILNLKYCMSCYVALSNVF